MEENTARCICTCLILVCAVSGPQLLAGQLLKHSNQPMTQCSHEESARRSKESINDPQCLQQFSRDPPQDALFGPKASI